MNNKMIQPDYTKKRLIVMISYDKINGIVYNPTLINNRDHETADRLYNEFIGGSMKHILHEFEFETEMGPGEFVETHPETSIFITNSGMLVGGYIAPFSITDYQKLVDVLNNVDRLTTSFEKQEYL